MNCEWTMSFALAFRRLRVSVEADPDLLDSIPAARDLEQQAIDVCHGITDVRVWDAPVTPPRIPNADQARRIIEVVSTIPSPPNNVSNAQRVAIASVHANLLTHITWDVMDRYSHLIPNPSPHGSSRG